MSWLYQENVFEDPQDYWGFVYIITNFSTDKKYIGKKQFYFKKYKTIKGKRKGYMAESDWKTYFGSNETLKEEVQNGNSENFQREIIKLCKSKSECTYWETKYIFEYDALLKPNEYYNGWVMARVRRSQLIPKSKIL